MYGGNPKNFWNINDSDLAGSQVSYERINLKNKSSNNSSNDLRLGDSRHICISLRKFEFFAPVEQFIELSDYFKKLYNYILTEAEAKRHKGAVDEPLS
ncbi:MAG: hypothetical protein ACK56F_21310 [bacterium]